MIEYLIAGPKFYWRTPVPRPGPLWQLAAMKYAGLFFGSLFLGLIYSTLIAFSSRGTVGSATPQKSS